MDERVARILENYERRGWIVIALPADVAAPIVGAQATQLAAMEVSGRIAARERILEESTSINGDKVREATELIESMFRDTGYTRLRRAAWMLREALGEPDFYRADGRMICAGSIRSCGRMYLDHPVETFGELHLHRLCNGQLVKL